MHLFNKENIWSNPCSFLHTSSHPDKYNNSVNRIISKEKEREDPKERFFKDLIPARIQECFQCFYTQSSILQINSIHRINSTRNTRKLQQLPGSFHTGLLQQLFPVYPSILHGRIKLQASLQYPRLPRNRPGRRRILGGRNSILHGSQPPRAPYSNSQAHTTRNPLSIY